MVRFAAAASDASVAVYAISDLHTDYSANLEWVEQLAAPPTRGLAGHTNVLIVAGEGGGA
jgi:hypothetical protein